MRSLVPALAGALATLLITACGSGSDEDANIAAHATPPAAAAREALTAGRWRIRVAVRPSRLGPIVVAAKNLARAKPTNSHPWIQHELVFRNRRSTGHVRRHEEFEVHR